MVLEQGVEVLLEVLELVLEVVLELQLKKSIRIYIQRYLLKRTFDHLHCQILHFVFLLGDLGRVVEVEEVHLDDLRLVEGQRLWMV